MRNTQTWNRILLILSGVGAVAVLAPLFFDLPFPLCAAVTLLCYLAGAVIVLFVIPKNYRENGAKKKLPVDVRTVNLAFWANTVLALITLPYVGLVEQHLTYAVVLVSLSYAAIWGTLVVLVHQARK